MTRNRFSPFWASNTLLFLLLGKYILFRKYKFMMVLVLNIIWKFSFLGLEWLILIFSQVFRSKKFRLRLSYPPYLSLFSFSPPSLEKFLATRWSLSWNYYVLFSFVLNRNYLLELLFFVQQVLKRHYWYICSASFEEILSPGIGIFFSACFEEILSLSWNWDYIMNISESDLPVKPIQQFENHLRY